MRAEAINVIIVDDEIEACSNLSFLITRNQKYPVHVLGFAHNTVEAAQKIALLKPEAVFLDIEMPNENAFQFLSRLGNIDFEIVFVTAYDEYAVKAFKLNALGYILKPIDTSDLERTIELLRDKILFNRFRMQQPQRDIQDILKNLEHRTAPSQLVLNDTNHWEIVSFSNIVYIQASGSYSKIFCSGGSGATSRILSKPISEYEDLLPKNLFYRVHKSYLVNCLYIRRIQKGDSKDIVLADGTVIPVGRRRYPEFLEFIKSDRFHELKD